MTQDWHIEEELIEWCDTLRLSTPFDVVGIRPRYAREMRLVNPKGEIVGRRLAIGSLREHYLVF